MFEIRCQRCGELVVTFKMTDVIQLAMAKVRAHNRIPHHP